MLKIEFDPSNKSLAAAIGRALMDYAGAAPAANDAPVGKSVDTAAESNPPTNSADAASEEECASTESESPASAGSATDPATSTTTQTSGPARVDEKGVAFDPKMCAKAAKPFYASGPMKGQWKKRGGAEGPTQEEYDAWYAGELANVPKEEPGDFDVAGQFGQQPAEQETTAGAGTPKHLGEFSAWAASNQAAGNFTAEDVTNAYAATGYTVQDLLPTNPKAAENCATMVTVIESAKA